MLDTIKTAEDSDAIVLRLYECHGSRGTARIRVATPFKKAVRVNVLEDEFDALTVEGQDIILPFGPYEIVGIKLT